MYWWIIHSKKQKNLIKIGSNLTWIICVRSDPEGIIDLLPLPPVLCEWKQYQVAVRGFRALSDKYFIPDLILHNRETLKPLMNIKRITHFCPVSKAGQTWCNSYKAARVKASPNTQRQRHLLPTITAFCLFTQSYNYRHESKYLFLKR